MSQRGMKAGKRATQSIAIKAWLPGPDSARAEKFTIQLEGAGATVIVRALVLEPVEFVAVSVTSEVPAVVGGAADRAGQGVEG